MVAPKQPSPIRSASPSTAPGRNETLIQSACRRDQSPGAGTALYKPVTSPTRWSASGARNQRR
jgi:hypothetical protein